MYTSYTTLFKAIVFFILSFWGSLSYAQTELELDSVYQFYKKTNIEYNLHFTEGLNVFDKYDISLNKLLSLIFEHESKNPNEVVHTYYTALKIYLEADSAFHTFKPLDDITPINNLLKKALSIKDETFNAHIFSICGATLDVMKQTHYAIYYFKRANSLFEKNLPECLTYYENTCFELSKKLYHAFEFNYSIQYGLKFLELLNNKTSINNLTKVYTLDLLGAAYMQLNNLDSSAYYYNHLHRFLENHDLGNDYTNELWMSIVQGNQGKLHLLNNNLDSASFYINQYYDFNTRNKDYYNISNSKNLKGLLLYKKGKIQEAKKLWLEVYHDSTAYSKIEIIKDAAYGLMLAYKKQNNLDSALYFTTFYMQKVNEVEMTKTNYGLKVVETQLEIENLENNLTQTKQIIDTLKISRNLTIISLVLLCSVIYLISKLQKSKLKYSILQENAQRQLAEQKYNDFINKYQNLSQTLEQKDLIVNELENKLFQVRMNKKEINLKELVNKLIITNDNDWLTFTNEFYEVHPLFYSNLKKHNNNISPSALRLAILMKIGLNNNQIANALGISPSSVTKAKYRLKIDLNISSPDELDQIIQNL